MRRKHRPQRTCVGCRMTSDKNTLTRVVRSNDSVMIDPTGKLNGRGAYVHNQLSCWKSALDSHLSKALRIEISENDKSSLEKFISSLDS